MPTTQARPEVVVLLCDADYKRLRETKRWYHLDGRPFSEEERERAENADPVELEEMRSQSVRYQAYVRTVMDAPADLERFLAPFMERLSVKTLGNAVDLMNDDERAELNRHLARIVKPVRRFAPYTF
ncbi:hypothetical protein HFP71_17230 [Streptomyces sp. ARC32]|uniref:hypothetical protein n=1 Tax=Streptomyces TaxID=1883 RepID=UPI001C1E5FC9|nr:hypothetical protein [Streptomyces sp. A108]MBU6530961.1 hypothetical protein [Streptomyces sp. A108]